MLMGSLPPAPWHMVRRDLSELKEQLCQAPGHGSIGFEQPHDSSLNK